MQKIINVLAIASSVVSLTVVGGGVYLYTQKDAIVDSVKEKVMSAVSDTIPGMVGGSLPKTTGLPVAPKAAPIPNSLTPPMP